MGSTTYLRQISTRCSVDGNKQYSGPQQVVKGHSPFKWFANLQLTKIYKKGKMKEGVILKNREQFYTSTAIL